MLYKRQRLEAETCTEHLEENKDHTLADSNMDDNSVSSYSPAREDPSEEEMRDAETIDDIEAIGEYEFIPQIQCTPPQENSQPDVDIPDSNYTHPNSREDRMNDVNEEPSCSQNSTQSSTEQNSDYKPFRSLEELQSSVLANPDLFPGITLNRISHPKKLLIIPKEISETMDGHSKSLALETDDPGQSAEEGVELSFIFPMPSAGIPKEASKVIYFFSKILSISQNSGQRKFLNGFCVPTETLKTEETPDGKVTHIVKEVISDGNEDFEMEDVCDQDGVCLAKVIEMEELSTEGRKRKRVPILSIRVCITGAVVQLSEDDVRHELFCNVRVCSLQNLSLLNYIVNNVLSATGIGQPHLRKESDELQNILHEIIMYQSGHVIGDKNTEMPKDYYVNPTGRMGVSTLCNPFYDSLKMKTMLAKTYPDIEFLSIIGFYDINWLDSPKTNRELKSYMRYVSAYNTEIKKVYSEMEAALERHNGKRHGRKSQGGKKKQTGDGASVAEEPEPEEIFKFTPIFGYPVMQDVFAGKQHFCKFQRTLCPIVMVYRVLDFDIPRTFQEFLTRFGSLPEAVLASIMDFLLFDYKNPNNICISEFILENREEATLSKVMAKYYSEAANFLDGIVHAGCLRKHYTKITEIIRKGISDGRIDPKFALEMYFKCETYCNQIFQGYLEGGHMHSLILSQKDKIVKEAMKKGISKNIQHYKSKMKQRSNDDVDPFVQSQAFILNTICDANKSMHLNPLNLRIFFSLLNSVCHYHAPRDSDDVPAIGQGIFLIPGCGTLSETMSNRQEVPVIGCPNSAGKDFVANHLISLYKSACAILGTDEIEIVENLARATAVSLEDSVAVTVENGKIVKMPDYNILWKYFIDTEMRGSHLELLLNGIINMVAQRGKNQHKSTMTTADREGQRYTQLRYQIVQLTLGYLCTNQSIDSGALAEKLRTLQIVLEVQPPGCTPVEQNSETNRFGDVSVNAGQARSTDLEGEEGREIVVSLVIPHLCTQVRLNLPLWAGAGPLKVSPVVNAAVDFMIFYIKEHLTPMFHTSNGKKNFSRIRDVFTSKASSITSWTMMVQALTENSNMDLAFIEARRKLQFDAIALPQVPEIAFELISRCLHWGPIIVSNLFIQEVGMPIVPMEDLIKIFQLKQEPPVSDGNVHTSFGLIRDWLRNCVHSGRFCHPSGTEVMSSVCQYISSSFLQDGSPLKNCMFRVDNTPNGWNVDREKNREKQEIVSEKLSENLKKLHGRQLFEACSFTEGCIPMIISDMLKHFSVYIPKFLEISQSNTEGLLKLFGVWGMHSFELYNADQQATPPFAIKTAYFEGPGRCLNSGIGVDPFQLLLLGSIAGESCLKSAHPKMIYDLSKGLVSLILSKMPRAALPRKYSFISCYNSVSYETIKNPHDDPIQIEHFIRPKDVQMVLTNNPSQFSNVRKFAPEDVLHMPGLCSMVSYFDFELPQCPPSRFYNYHIRNKKHYCAYNRELERMGLLFYDGASVIFTHYPKEDTDDDGMSQPLSPKSVSDESSSSSSSDEASEDSDEEVRVERRKQSNPSAEVTVNLNPKTWQRELADQGYILLPMITRSGACVCLADEEMGERVGVLVPPPIDRYADCNFHVKERVYYVSATNRRARNYVKMSPFQVFSCLLPVGSKLFLKLDCQNAQHLVSSACVSASRRSDFVLYVVLTTPNVVQPEPGKVYVSYMLHGGQKCDIVCVYPSDLLIRSDGYSVLREVK